MQPRFVRHESRSRLEKFEWWFLPYQLLTAVRPSGCPRMSLSSYRYPIDRNGCSRRMRQASERFAFRLRCMIRESLTSRV